MDDKKYLYEPKAHAKIVITYQNDMKKCIDGWKALEESRQLVYWTEIDEQLKIVFQSESGNGEPYIMGIDEWKYYLNNSEDFKNARSIRLEITGIDSGQVYKKAQKEGWLHVEKA